MILYHEEVVLVYLPKKRHQGPVNVLTKHPTQ